MKLLVALPILVATVTHSAALSQDKQLQRACDETASAVHGAVAASAATDVVVVGIPFRVVVPGTLTGRIALNPSGSTIRVAGDRSGTGGFGCADGAVGPGVPRGRGHSQVVSTLRRTFTAAGRYTLNFAFNATGRRILARLGARVRAYRTRHPHGHKPPSIAFGVGLSYTPAG